MMTKNKKLSECQAQLRAMDVLRLLNGLTVGEARWVLEEAKLILNCTHLVTVDNPLFTEVSEGLLHASGEED